MIKNYIKQMFSFLLLIGFLGCNFPQGKDKLTQVQQLSEELVFFNGLHEKKLRDIILNPETKGSHPIMSDSLKFSISKLKKSTMKGVLFNPLKLDSLIIHICGKFQQSISARGLHVFYYPKEESNEIANAIITFDAEGNPKDYFEFSATDDEFESIKVSTLLNSGNSFDTKRIFDGYGINQSGDTKFLNGEDLIKWKLNPDGSFILN